MKYLTTIKVKENSSSSIAQKLVHTFVEKSEYFTLLVSSLYLQESDKQPHNNLARAAACSHQLTVSEVEPTLSLSSAHDQSLDRIIGDSLRHLQALLLCL